MTDQSGMDAPDIQTFLETEETFDSTKKGIVFSLEAPADATVQIAGDFNNWIPESLFKNSLHGKSVWQKAISLAPGTYAYKYVINGNWISDPTNNHSSDDRQGGRNSLIKV